MVFPVKHTRVPCGAHTEAPGINLNLTHSGTWYWLGRAEDDGGIRKQHRKRLSSPHPAHYI